MSYLKVNKSNLEATITYAQTARSYLHSAYQNLKDFAAKADEYCGGWGVSNFYSSTCNRTNVSKSDYSYTVKENGKSVTKIRTDEYVAACVAKASELLEENVQSFKAQYKDIATLYFKAWAKIGLVWNAFYKVQILLDEYESTKPSSLQEAFEKGIARHEDYEYDENSYSWEYEEDDDGKLVLKDFLTLLNGEYVSNNVGANAFITSAGAIPTALYTRLCSIVNDDEFKNLSPEQQQVVIQREFDNVEDNLNKVQERINDGFYSISNEQELAEWYENKTGVKYDKDRVDKEAAYVLEKFGLTDQDKEWRDKFGALTGAALTGFGVNNFASQNGVISDEELGEDGFGYIAEGRKNVENGSNLDEEGNVDKEKLIDPEAETKPEVEEPSEKEEIPVIDRLGSQESDPGVPGISTTEEGGSGPTPDIESKIEEEIPVPDEPVPEIEPSDRVVNEIEDPVPEVPVMDKKLTNEDVDQLAEDKFYEQYSPEELAEYRNNQIDEFNSLYDNDKDSLINQLNDAGYSINEAEALADDKNLGLAAFLAAKQSADMAEMSKSIAQGANMDMAMFDTRYDDGASFKDLVSGETNARMYNPNVDSNVANAKQEMNNAKARYDKAVDTANKSVDEANDNKDKLDSVKKQIVKKSGNDSNNWSEEDIDKYNDAVNEYNDSVRKANDDVAAAQNAKTDYENSKTTYENSKEEFYDRVKDEVLQNREASGGGGVPEPNPDDNVGGSPNPAPENNDTVGANDKGIGFGNGDSTPNDVGTQSVPDNNDVVDKGNGIGFADGNTSSDNASSNSFANDNNSEYIYNENTADGTNARVSDNGIGV